MVAIRPMEKKCWLKLFDHVGLELLNVPRAFPEHEPRGRKTFGVAPHCVQMRRIGEIVEIVRPGSVEIGEKQHVPIAIDQAPPCEMNRRNRVKFAQNEDLPGQDLGNKQDQPDHQSAKSAELDRRQRTHMILSAEIQILIYFRMDWKSAFHAGPRFAALVDTSDQEKR